MPQQPSVPQRTTNRANGPRGGLATALASGYAGTAPRHGAMHRSALRIARVAGERLSV
jgi:hypothetical protein